MRDGLEELRAREAEALTGGGPERLQAQHEKGKLGARERLELLLDPGSFFELDRLVTILPRLPVLDFALMMSDEELGPRLDQFTRSQRGRLRRPLKEIAGLLSPVVLAALVIAWLMLVP